jgi:hypothetical protein
MDERSLARGVLKSASVVTIAKTPEIYECLLLVSTVYVCQVELTIVKKLIPEITVIPGGFIATVRGPIQGVDSIHRKFGRPEKQQCIRHAGSPSVWML